MFVYFELERKKKSYIISEEFAFNAVKGGVSFVQKRVSHINLLEEFKLSVHPLSR